MYRMPAGSLIRALSRPNSLLRLNVVSKAWSDQIERLSRILPNRRLIDVKSFGWTTGAGGTTREGLSSMGAGAMIIPDCAFHVPDLHCRCIERFGHDPP